MKRSILVYSIPWSLSTRKRNFLQARFIVFRKRIPVDTDVMYSGESTTKSKHI